MANIPTSIAGTQKSDGSLHMSDRPERSSNSAHRSQAPSVAETFGAVSSSATTWHGFNPVAPVGRCHNTFHAPSPQLRTEIETNGSRGDGQHRPQLDVQSESYKAVVRQRVQENGGLSSSRGPTQAHRSQNYCMHCRIEVEKMLVLDDPRDITYSRYTQHKC